MPESHWPWWIGALGIAAVFLAVRLWDRRWMGVSGSLGRVLTPGEWAADRVRERMKADARATEAALLRATLEHFGPEALPPAVPTPGEPRSEPAGPLPQTVHLTFLLSLLAGGALSAMLSGHWRWSTHLGETFARVIGVGWPAIVVLFLGGLLTGIGTRMAGGCTSGHGITGCARLHRASFLSTAAFFGTGIVTSMLLHWLSRG